MIRRRAAWACAAAAGLILSLPLAVAAAESAAHQGNAPTPAELVQRGRMLYAHRCSHCHGFNMVSAGTVTYDLRNFPHDQEERFLESVVNGKNNRMPPWGDTLSIDDIKAIWAYVQTGGK